MKQTVEEAARTHWSESTYNKDAELAYDERDSIAIKALAKAIALRAFKKGAEWRINSLWHKTKDEVPQAHGEYENDRCGNCDCPTVMKRQACEKAKNAKEYNEKPKIK